MPWINVASLLEPTQLGGRPKGKKLATTLVNPRLVSKTSLLMVPQTVARWLLKLKEVPLPSERYCTLIGFAGIEAPSVRVNALVRRDRSSW